MSKRPEWVRAVISIVFLAAYIGLQAFVVLNPGDRDDLVSARLQDALMLILAYWFGASHKKQ